jgi:hypothetical protein
MKPVANGIIIILAYPDTIVRPAYTEFSSKIWPKIGIGGKHAVKAGHAALLLLKKNNSEIKYYDFGRYITPFGFGRVRSKDTDFELAVPVEAKFKNNKLSNFKEIILWVEKHPKKTHGDGKLVTTINHKINYERAIAYITSLIDQKEIPYGAFTKGSNCARFVTDTIIAASTKKKVSRKLKTSNLFTPSPIGNIIKGNTTDEIFEVYQQKITEYQNRSVLKEYKESFLQTYNTPPNLIGTEKPNLKLFHLKSGTWLGGIGSGAWFIISKQVSEHKFEINRFTADGIVDFTGTFQLENTDFNLTEKHEFLHPTNCMEAFVKQNAVTYFFKNTNYL